MNASVRHNPPEVPKAYVLGADLLPPQVPWNVLVAGGYLAAKLLGATHTNIVVHDTGDDARLGAMTPCGSTHIIFLDVVSIRRWAKRPWDEEAVSQFGHQRPRSWRVRPRKRMALVEAMAYVLVHEVTHVVQYESGRYEILDYLAREDEASALAFAHYPHVAAAMRSVKKEKKQ